MDMKNAVKHIWKYLATGILGLLGFASCGKKLVDIAVMYGQPHADFQAMGTVSDEDGNPIKGIRVSVRLNYAPWSQEMETTLYTGDKGDYHFVGEFFTAPTVTISFEDVDGEENGGEFASAEVSPEVVRIMDGDKKWYEGAFEVRADVQLKKK